MNRLLAIELQKIWKNRASRILTISYFALLSSIALIASLKFDFGPIHFDIVKMGIFNFPYIWHFNTFFASWFKLFLAVIIVSMMSNEYTYGTLKQNLIDGMSKKEFILSKFFTVALFAFASTIFVFIMTLILGYSFSSYTEIGIVFSQMEYLLAFFVELLGFFSVCLFLGVLIRKSAFALGFLLIWKLFEGICYLAMKWLLFDTWEKSYQALGYFPLQSISNLIAEPSRRLSAIKTAGNQAGFDMNYDYSIHLSSILIVLIYTVIFIYSSYIIIKKRDL
ncbi:ABC transporter permease [Flavobacterium sp.]|uniref:ABC transporter permease n=1 Tax=Flavobacterium sp. TaxID=239 RepID=UPI002486E3FB|nr:ABC transporter permease [Flavobacterium sp.]MDI1317308.1 ABC transporter permease [Flavobacterium sp.]